MDKLTKWDKLATEKIFCTKVVAIVNMNEFLRLFVALTGIQYAGGHLRELQKAVKNPISNFGVVLGEVSKRAKGGIGIGSGNLLADKVTNCFKK